MQFFDIEWQTSEEVIEAIPHGSIGATIEGSDFAPAGGYIHHLQAIDIHTTGTRTAMVNQIHLRMPRPVCLPIDALNRDQPAELFLPLTGRLAEGKFGIRLSSLFQQPFHC